MSDRKMVRRLSMEDLKLCTPTDIKRYMSGENVIMYCHCVRCSKASHDMISRHIV